VLANLKGAPREKKKKVYDATHDPGDLPAGRFQTIVADPPWNVGHATEQYPTMTTAAIKAMGAHVPTCLDPACDGCGVWKKSAPNCHLYLWGINARLQDALDVLEAWGFKYVSQIIWNKTTKDGIRTIEDKLGKRVWTCASHSGQGQGYRTTHEFILFGVKNLPPRSHSFDTQFYAPKQEKHSAKPDDYFWPMVMDVSPPPYLELFSRRCWTGKKLDGTVGTVDAVWGNQAQEKPKKRGRR